MFDNKQVKVVLEIAGYQLWQEELPDIICNCKEIRMNRATKKEKKLHFKKEENQLK